MWLRFVKQGSLIGGFEAFGVLKFRSSGSRGAGRVIERL